MWNPSQLVLASSHIGSEKNVKFLRKAGCEDQDQDNYLFI